MILEAVVLATILATGNPLWIYALMWSVAISSIITRIVLREGFSDISFRFGGRSTWWYVGFGLWVPLVVGFVAWGAAWITGIADFVPQAAGMTASFADGSSAIATFAVTLVLAATTVGTLFNMLSAAGEEIGWRGYMTARMIDAGVPRPLLVSGIIWGLWHMPLIFVGINPERPIVLVAAIVFVVAATSMSYILNWVRLQTGSLWPVVVLHGAHNSITQTAFIAATDGGAFWILVEVGVLVAVVITISAVIVCRKPWAMLRTPDDPH